MNFVGVLNDGSAALTTVWVITAMFGRTMPALRSFLDQPAADHARVWATSTSSG